MKRLTRLVLGGLLGVVSTALGYDGPSPKTYDQTINGIRVVLTSQGKMSPGGFARFTMTARVPVLEAGSGALITLEIRKANPADPDQYRNITTCRYIPRATDIGRTIEIPCNANVIVPFAGWETTTVRVYPRVRQQLKSAPSIVHDGLEKELEDGVKRTLDVEVKWDDPLEDNDDADFSTATPLGAAPFVFYDDLVSTDSDYYQFTVPAGMEATQICIRFWNTAADLELLAFNWAGTQVGESSSPLNDETITLRVFPGETYYLLVYSYSGLPAFYDLSLVHQPPDGVALVWGPFGSPNPVTPGDRVSLAALGVGLGEAPLQYSWSVECPDLGSEGTLSNASTDQPTWIAPPNDLGTQRACIVSVAVSNAHHVIVGSYTQIVDPASDYLTLVTPPLGTPNPVSSGGSIQLSVEVADSLDHAIAYQWDADCGDLGDGAFFPSPNVQDPTVVVPWNTWMTPRGCVISVTASDAYGHSVQSSFYHVVMNHVDAVAVRVLTSVPNPAASGALVTLSASATDSFGHPVTVTWSSGCSSLPGAGSFPDGNVGPDVSWRAPDNRTGTRRACLLRATASDEFGTTATAHYAQYVEPIPHVFAITAGPSGTPEPVPSSGTVALRLSVTDSFLHPLAFAWSASCPDLPRSGQFVPGPNVQEPLWIAPENRTGSEATCSISVLVEDGHTQRLDGIYAHRVASVAPEVLIISGPSGAPDPVRSGGVVVLDVVWAHSLVNRSVDVRWDASCPALPSNGSFGLGAAEAIGMWTAPQNHTARQQSCVISVTLDDRQGHRATASYVQRVDPVTAYTYYLAEGATIGGFFETRVVLLNLDATDTADVIMEFQIKDTDRLLTHRLSVGARKRVTVDVSTLGSVNPALTELRSAEFSTIIHSTRRLIVDRTMTWDGAYYGAHSETSVPSAASTWYLAEGATLRNFELYYLIQNPNDVPLEDEIEVTYLLPPPRQPIVRTYSVGPHTRRNIVVHEEPGLDDAEMSAIIRTPDAKPVIVERAMYLSSPGLPFNAGHASAGITEPRRNWFFAEGATADFFDFFLLIANPNDAPTPVRVTYLFRDGTTCSAPVGSVTHGGVPMISAKSRFNVWVNREVISGCPHDLARASMSVTITSERPVIVERTMWWPGPTADTWAEAHNSAGAPSPGTTWAIADGEEGGEGRLQTYVLIANTSDFDGAATVTLYCEDGSVLQKTVELLKNSRTTVPVGAPRDDHRRQLGLAEADGFGFGDAADGKRFGIVIESLPVDGQFGPAQIVVERSSYWSVPGGAFWAAGTNTLGTKMK